MEEALLSAPVGFATAAAAVNELHGASPDAVAIIVEALSGRLQGRPIDSSSLKLVEANAQASRFAEFAIRAARKAGCNAKAAKAALLRSTDLSPAAAAAVAAPLASLSAGSGARALDTAPPASASLESVSWRVSLSVGSSLTGEAALPLAHVAITTADAAGARRRDTLELTLRELRALRAEVAVAIAAVDRA